MPKFRTLTEVLQYWAEHDGDRPAFIFRFGDGSRHVLTCSKLYTLGARWASVLHRDGLVKGQLVVNTLPNSPERAVCEAGILLAGATSVNGQCHLADGSDLLHVLTQSQASTIVLDPDLTWGPWTVLQQRVQITYDNKVTSDTLPALCRVYFIHRRQSGAFWNEASVDKKRKQVDLQETKQSVQSGSEQTAGAGKQKHTPINENGFGQCGQSTGLEVKDAEAPQTSTRNKDLTVKQLNVETRVTAGRMDSDVEDFLTSLEIVDSEYTAQTNSEDVATVFTTSGSTGFSKLVTYTHGAVVGFTTILTREDEYDKCDTFFSMSRMGSPSGYTLQQLCSGNCRLLLDERADLPDDRATLVWDVLASEKCQTALLPPALVLKILRLPNRAAWKLNVLSLTAQPIRRHVVKRCGTIANVALISYGSTELCLVTGHLVTDLESFRDLHVGRALPGCQVKICDESGAELPHGTRGEVYAKTTNMFCGYYNSPRETAAALTDDGYMRTKDVGVMLEDGSLCVEGRTQDAIHKGSSVFYPGWLEARIQRCPGLHDVTVVGVPDQDGMADICACFVSFDPAVTEEVVRANVEKDIVASDADPRSPRPRYYVRFESFPVTYTGKVSRQEVQEQAKRRISASASGAKSF